MNSQKDMPKGQFALKRRQKREAVESVVGIRECGLCVQPKPLDEFYVTKKRAKRHGGTYLHYYCKLCTALISRESRLWRLFNITSDEYDRILAFQGGGCAICGQIAKNYALNVDHDHKTGLIRGLVCWIHNQAIGLFRDSPELLKRAVSYLERPPAVTALGEQHFGVVGRLNTKRARGYARKVKGEDILTYLKRRLKVA